MTDSSVYTTSESESETDSDVSNRSSFRARPRRAQERPLYTIRHHFPSSGSEFEDHTSDLAGDTSTSDSSSSAESASDRHVLCDSGDDADVEDMLGPGDIGLEASDVPATTSLGQHCHHILTGMYKTRYEVPRVRLPRTPESTASHTLNVYKHERPDYFRKELRVSPYTFDKLTAEIIDDPAFMNNSQNAQLSVELQLAITLYRFGHYGNGASIHQTASWAGVSVGSVIRCTSRVMTAVLRSDFKQRVVRMPTAEEKEEAKGWVERRSCKAWRDGWCLVDGTLVKLAYCPTWFGESYFDRKNNYSLNVQVPLNCSRFVLYVSDVVI